MCTFIFFHLLFETPIVTFCFLAPRIRETRAFATRVSVSSRGVQSTEHDIVNRSLSNWAGVTNLRYTVQMEDETAVHCCDPALSVLVMFVVSKRLSRCISPQAFYCPPIIPLSLIILRRRRTDKVNPELCLKLQSEIM